MIIVEPGISRQERIEMTTIHISARAIRAYAVILLVAGIVLLVSTTALALAARPVAVAEPQGFIAILAGSAATVVGFRLLRHRGKES